MFKIIQLFSTKLHNYKKLYINNMWIFVEKYSKNNQILTEYIK